MPGKYLCIKGMNELSCQVHSSQSPFPTLLQEAHGLSVCQSNLIHTLERSSVGWNEEASQSPPGRTFFAQAVTSTSYSQLSPFLWLATLARACIALPVWSASTLILLQPHHDFIQVSILSHIQTVRIATSEITSLSWFLPFHLLYFPLVPSHVLTQPAPQSLSPTGVYAV